MTEPRPHEAQSTVVAHDGTRLFVRSRDGDSGAGVGRPRVILLDGLLCDGFIWKYTWDDLAKIVPLTHWHYRGHGRSAAPADPERIGIGAHAADLDAVRASLGDPEVVLVGHSMGCQVALENYRRHPDKVRGLVLICGSFGRITSTFHGIPILDLVLPKLIDLVIRRPNLARAIWSRVPPETAFRIALKAGEIDAERVSPADMMPYLQHMTHVELSMFLRMLRAAGDHSAWDHLPDVRVPTLVVAGERDTFTPAFLAQEMARVIPGAELLMVERGTHVASLEHPEVVNGRIRKFLEERVLGP